MRTKVILALATVLLSSFYLLNVNQASVTESAGCGSNVSFSPNNPITQQHTISWTGAGGSAIWVRYSTDNTFASGIVVDQITSSSSLNVDLSNYGGGTYYVLLALPTDPPQECGQILQIEVADY